MQGDLSRLVGSGPESFNVSQNQQKPPKNLIHWNAMHAVVTSLWPSI